MIKKLLIYFIIFFSLLFVNVFLAFSIISKNRKYQSTMKILSEINNGENTQQQFAKNSAPFVMSEFTSDIQTGDGRVANLKSFFRKHGSPLYDEADYIVKISDQYRFDYRLLPAIAMQESNLCKFIPENSNNCWGWGIYGTTVTRFDSYKDAINAVSAGLKKEYLDKGLIKASDIMEKYTPSSSGSWAHGVNSFLRILE